MQTNYTVKHTNTDIIFEGDSGEKLAFVSFNVKDNVYELYTTQVSETLRGMGIAGKLMELFYERCKKDGVRAVPVCSYAVKWFDKNGDKRDILA